MASAGAAFALLTVAQNSLSQLDPGPTPEVNVLFALVVFAVGLTLRRAQTLQQRYQTLDRLLRHWPLMKLSAIAPHELGVLTSQTDDTKYIPREIDRQLDEALASARVILIYGPPLAGKSRTAYERAKRSAGDLKVAIPEQDEALEEIWPLLDTARGSSPIILWLDGLERYLDAITADALNDIETADPAITLVATIRETAYQEAIGGAEEVTRAARLIRERARGFELPGQLCDKELACAQEQYPNVHFDEPVGKVLMGQLAGGHIPHPPPGAVEGSPGRYAHLKDRWLVLAAAICVVLVVAIVVLVATGNFIEEEQRETNAQSPVSERAHETWTGRWTLRYPPCSMTGNFCPPAAAERSASTLAASGDATLAGASNWHFSAREPRLLG